MPSKKSLAISEKIQTIKEILMAMNLAVETDRTVVSGSSAYRLDLYLPDFHTAIDVREPARRVNSLYRKERFAAIGLFAIAIQDDVWEKRNYRNQISEGLMDWLRNASATVEERRERFAE